jgi:uncharacterized protein (DUF486 family)
MPASFWWTVLLLSISNTFMTVAWYGHLKFVKTWPMWVAVLVSWGIAFFEYCFMVPANRIGAEGGMSTGKLKIVQEGITLVVFVAYVTMFAGEKLTWNYYVAFGLVMVAVGFVFWGRG